MRSKGGNLKKLAAAAVVGALIVAVPARADGTGAGRAAPVSSEFLTIGGPKRLHPGSNLRIPIRCSVECGSTVLTKLKLPDDQIGPDKTTGHFSAGITRKLVVTLDDAATQDVKDHYRGARLRVGVSAVDSSSGDRAHAVKVFKFTRP
jgi:hypothetical protein